MFLFWIKHASTDFDIFPPKRLIHELRKLRSKIGTDQTEGHLRDDEVTSVGGKWHNTMGGKV